MSLKGMEELQLLEVAREIEEDCDLVVECARLKRLTAYASGRIQRVG